MNAYLFHLQSEMNSWRDGRQRFHEIRLSSLYSAAFPGISHWRRNFMLSIILSAVLQSVV